MKYLSLFTGIGGFELGIQQAYENIRKGGKSGQLEGIRGHKPDVEGDGQDEQYPSCIGYSEIDKYAIQTYQSHFPNHKNYGDITKINEKELPDFDLLCGGFPCQAFSIAGKREGFADTRGTLFFDIARILKEKHPRLLFLENVKGLLSHDGGRTFKVILSTLTELGYDLQWQVLNSKNFGVPQNRERVFIIGHLRGTPRPEVFPFGTGDEKNDLEINILGHKDCYRRANQVFDKNGITETLSTCGGGGQHPCTTDDRKIISSQNQRKDFKTSDICNTITSSYRGSPDGDGRPGVLENDTVRRLTPTECERLQGFPDNWTIGSDTQRYKQCGNAVTVNVIQAIAEKLLTPTPHRE